ncbi:UDP-N-acetylhexosamine pyrophosphorylase [Orussus abietinus]|uniref:UDP-N-acetylhexosamine pyrophosphorylase n=1 Tax=Orussus abietinus TaxID=222816 RepID=UPI0006265F97|nr:UDP-N-acetylhexosamine pyrophosphorylase [Orussus abietinus]XP_023289624.1 UDP-N-acetylhexosamine pyrophosphorylase [Orussus abietinus]
MDKVQLIDILSKYNQEHLLRFWDELSESDRCQLRQDILELDLAETKLYFSKAMEGLGNKQLLKERISPIPSEAISSYRDISPEKVQHYEELGLKEISEGRVAVILMAGGQGTRLGMTNPKGMCDVGLPSSKTLFCLQAERIRSLQNIVEKKFGIRSKIMWYILTSEATDQPTIEYFQANNYFGLDEENVKMFKQGMLPCFTLDGKIILDKKYQISKAPDGNGGLYRALKVQGILDDMKIRGIRSVHVHSVDNILIKVADPVFIGYCLSRSADCGVKVLGKSSPTEAVGIVCQVDGEYHVVEYSEIPLEIAQLRNNDGQLLFNAANICNHYFTVDFLYEIGHNCETNMELHAAKKKIPYVDDNGVKCTSTIPNGIKIEKFIFDVFKFSTYFAALEVKREYEFSPVKNSDSVGNDCPSTARKDLLNLHRTWLLNSGAASVKGDVEVSPLISYAGENLTEIVQGKDFEGPLTLK